MRELLLILIMVAGVLALIGFLIIATYLVTGVIR